MRPRDRRALKGVLGDAGVEPSSRNVSERSVKQFGVGDGIQLCHDEVGFEGSTADYAKTLKADLRSSVSHGMQTANFSTKVFATKNIQGLSVQGGSP